MLSISLKQYLMTVQHTKLETFILGTTGAKEEIDLTRTVPYAAVLWHYTKVNIRLKKRQS